MLSKRKVDASFDATQKVIWTRAELIDFIGNNAESWKTTKPRTNPDAIDVRNRSVLQVLNTLTKTTFLQAIKLDFPHRAFVRYIWRESPTYSIIQSVDLTGYFSHYTAMHIHGLTDQIPKAIYFNVEQPANGEGNLTQAGIDRAFGGKCRVTNNVIEFRGLTIHKLNGKNTGRTGVIESEMEDGSKISVTDLERTLIDIAVRPIYSGGIAEVAAAYRAAASEVSGNRLATHLKMLNFTYPYHQAIGFYMEKSGNYTEAQLSRIRAIPMKYDFYLTYQIKNPIFNANWKLYVPEGF